MKPIIALLFAVLILAACDTNTAALPEEGTIGLLSVETQGYVGIPQEPTSAVFPSTNQNNIDNDWAHVLINGDDAVQLGSIELLFTSTRGFASCFEYRLDDEAPASATNYNPGATDGLWEFTCRNNASSAMTLTPTNYVDVRLAFGAEEDERFAWNRFWVLTELTKDDCKNGAWQQLNFRNQGQCIATITANANSRH